MEERMKRELQEMLDELESSSLEVMLSPAPAPQHDGHMVRVAYSKNAHWYRKLCERYPRSWKTRSSTVIHRKWIMTCLRRLIDGRGSQSKYANDLIDLAGKRLDRGPF